MASISTASGAPREITISSWVVNELVMAVERAGVDRDEFRRRAAEIMPEWLEADEFRLPRSEAFALCGVALDVTQDPALGLHWGEWLEANSFNLLPHLLAHAATLRQALEALLRFGTLATDQLGLELVERDDEAEIRRIDTGDQPLAVRRLCGELTALGLWRLVREFGGPGARITSVCFPYPAPSYRSEYTRIFGGLERFDQAFTGLVFERALLQSAAPRKDVALYATLSDLAERRLTRLQSRVPYSEQVRQLLAQQGAPHRVPMRQVAGWLGLSVRSLHRRLREEGQSYVPLASEVSAKVAKHLLVDELQTIRETARYMGFHDVGSFHRAFRRWTGTTPGAFRNDH
jgi:AraC-like DNA-binding protein